MYLAFSVARMICGEALTKEVIELLAELLNELLTLRKLGEIRTAFFEEGREGFFASAEANCWPKMMLSRAMVSLINAR